MRVVRHSDTEGAPIVHHPEPWVLGPWIPLKVRNGVSTNTTMIDSDEYVDSVASEERLM